MKIAALCILISCALCVWVLTIAIGGCAVAELSEVDVSQIGLLPLPGAVALHPAHILAVVGVPRVGVAVDAGGTRVVDIAARTGGTAGTRVVGIAARVGTTAGTPAGC